MISALTIKEKHSDTFEFLGGDLTSAANSCRLPSDARHDSLVFVSDPSQISGVGSRRPAIVIVRAGADAGLAPFLSEAGCRFSVQDISVGMALLLQYFDRKRERFTAWGRRHESAVVHSTARIGDNVVIGPFCVFGAGVKIGDRCVIGSHSVIENDATIGADTIIHPHVFIGAGCEVGSACEIHPHTSVGSDGFGYVAGANGRPKKIPHLGNVVIGDHVEIGSNCAIDRATIRSTFIRSGTKVDNLCHIAHNCDLGENGFYTAGFMMGGSTTIGKHFTCGGNAVVTSHVTLGDHVTLAGRSTVTKDLPLAGSYAGYPLQPLGEALRTSVNLRRLNEMSRQLAKISKHLGVSIDPNRNGNLSAE